MESHLDVPTETIEHLAVPLLCFQSTTHTHTTLNRTQNTNPALGSMLASQPIVAAVPLPSDVGGGAAAATPTQVAPEVHSTTGIDVATTAGILSGHVNKDVRTLDDMLMWASHFVQQLSDTEVNRLARWLDKPMSSAFSGVEAPGVARCALAQAVNERTGRTIVPETLSCIECDKDAQQELLLHPSGGCVLGNLNDFWVPFLRPVVKKLEATPGKAWAVLKPSVLAGRAITTQAHCLRHGQMCRIVEAHVHIAGTCCQDHSDFGSQRGLQGKGAAALLAWIGLRRLLQEPEIIQENVKTFPPVILYCC